MICNWIEGTVQKRERFLCPFAEPREPFFPKENGSFGHFLNPLSFFHTGARL